MKIVVGVDSSDAGAQAARLVARLRFAAAEIELVYVVERFEVLGYGEPVPADLIDRLLAEQEQVGRESLARAHAVVKEECGLDARMTMRQGFAAAELLAAAAKADLLAVGSVGKGRVEGFLYGSVSRKVITAAGCSVLVAKPRRLVPAPLTAVIATDHSPYADRCFERLVQLDPRGIARATVVTAYPKRLGEAVKRGMPHFKADVGRWVEKNLEAENRQLMDRLAAFQWQLESRVSDHEVTQAIRETAEDTGADLIIVGAQGHGYLQRWMLGSVSYRVATESDRHTLVVRVSDALHGSS